MLMEAVILILVFLAFILVLGKLFPSGQHQELQELTKRVARLEKALRSQQQHPPAQQDASPKDAKDVEPIVASPLDAFQQAVQEPTLTTLQPTLVPITEVEPSLLPEFSAAQADTLERYVGQRVIGWAAVALGIFAIGFFIKYAYDQGWIIPAGRVAIGEVIGLGLMAAGWRLHRKGQALGSQMLLGCGIAACYLATYAAFGFYQLISQPAAGCFLCAVMALAGGLAVVTNAFSLGLLTVLGGLLTPFMLNTGEDQHTSLFMYLLLLVVSIHLLYLWKPWRTLRSLVWLGALLHYGLWYQVHYTGDSRIDCFWFLGLLGLIPLIQVWWRGRTQETKDEDCLLYLVTPLVLFSLVAQMLYRDMPEVRGKLALAISLFYAGISLHAWLRRRHDYQQVQLALSVTIIFLAIAIPLELRVEWIGMGWITQGVLLWAAGLVWSERLVRFFGAGALLLGTVRLFAHDIYLHPAIGTVPFLNLQAIPGIWLVGCWGLASLLTFVYQHKVHEGERIAVVASVISTWLLWLVVSIEVYPYCKTWDVTQRWMGPVWMLIAWLFFASGCKLHRMEWRINAFIMIVMAVIRSMANDLPMLRHSAFVPLFNQLALPVISTAAMLLALRPTLIRYESTFHDEEKLYKPVTGLAALVIIFVILSLDTYQFCVVQYRDQQLLPHAVLSVVWALYGAMLLFVGFWKELATLRWLALGIFALTLGKVLMFDLSWLAGLYRILALLFIALVLAGVTRTYQRRK